MLPGRTWTGLMAPTLAIPAVTCSGTGETVDSRGMLCNCTEGQLQSCCRYRREWNTLSSTEKQNYLTTIHTVATDARYKQLYNNLIALHKTSYEPGRSAQNPNNPLVSQFIPWHRYFLLEYEDLIRLVDSSITVPYWDWTPMNTAPYSLPIFSPVIGFGNSSNASTGCVNTGPFREGAFTTTPSAGGGCLERDYDQTIFPTRMSINDIIAENVFTRAHTAIQHFIHINVRCLVGGHMCNDDAANDPLYITLLATIDQIMSQWQARSPMREAVRYASDSTPLDINLGQGLVVSDFALNSNLPNGISVCYSSSQPSSTSPGVSRPTRWGPSRLQDSSPSLGSATAHKDTSPLYMSHR